MSFELYPLCSLICSFAGFSEDRAQQLRERQQREMREAQERLRAEWADDEVKSDIFVVIKKGGHAVSSGHLI